MSTIPVLPAPDDVDVGNPTQRNPPRRDHRRGLFRGVPRLGGIGSARCRRPCARAPIAVSGNRQSVQHRDGGVVTAIHVREGQHVRAGDVLIELVSARAAGVRAGTDQRLSDPACAARAAACRKHRPARLRRSRRIASLPAEDRELAQQALALAAFGNARPRRDRISAQRSVLGQRAGQLVQQQGGYVKQREALIASRS